MDIIFSAFNELTPKQTEQLLALRQRVFIIEQQCFYEDIDGYDDQAHHLLFYKGDTLAAYLRLFEPGVKYAEASMGRIVVEPTFRGTSTGPTLIRKGIELCKGKAIRIEAQAALVNYYHQFGFVEEGNIYPVDEIPHIQMVLD